MRLKYTLLLLLFLSFIKQSVAEGITGYSYHSELAFTTTKTGEFSFTLGVTMLNHIKDPILINTFPSVYIYWNGVKQEINWFDIVGSTKIKSPMPLTGTTEVVIQCPIYHPIGKFICNDNEVTQINFAPQGSLYESKHLYNLGCKGNKLTSIATDILTGLKTLDCSSNSIGYLMFKSGSGIETIECSNNNIERLLFSTSNRLTEMYCNGNQIKQLALAEAPNLEVLECTNNNLTELNFSENKKLERIDCSYNPILKLQLTGLKNLTYLRCVENGLTQLDLEPVEKLKNLNCALNSLTKLDLPNQMNLIDLSCGGNLLTNLQFNQSTNIEYFDCQENPIQKIDVSLLKKLRTLNTNTTNLDELVLDHPNLVQLYCFNSKLKVLKLSGVPKLNLLNCSSNQLETLDLTECPNLKYIYCSYNQLKALHISSLATLDELSCKYNKLKFSTLPKLQFVYEGDEYDGIVGKGYFYAPQRIIEETNTLPYGSVIDLSSEYEVNYESVHKAQTTYQWYNSNGDEIPSHLYQGDNGKFIFGEDFANQKLICKMRNPFFWRDLISSSTKLDLTYEVHLSGKNSVVINQDSTSTNGNKGTFELCLHNTASANITSGEFIVILPDGFSLDENATLLAENLRTTHNLRINRIEKNIWLLTITPSDLKSKNEVMILKIADIVYNIDSSLENGSYDITVENLLLNFSDTSSIHQTSISTTVHYANNESSIIRPSDNNSAVFVEGRLLYINTPNAENITIYSSLGNMIYNKTKGIEDNITIDISNYKGIFIIKGSSGWIRKIKL